MDPSQHSSSTTGSIVPVDPRTGLFQKCYQQLDEEECISFISDSITQILRMSTNEEFRQECFQLLGASNAVDAGESLKRELANSINIKVPESDHKTLEQIYMESQASKTQANDDSDSDDNDAFMDLGICSINRNWLATSTSNSQVFEKLQTIQNQLSQQSQSSISTTMSRPPSEIKCSQWISLDVPSQNKSISSSSQSTGHLSHCSTSTSRYAGQWIAIDTPKKKHPAENFTEDTSAERAEPVRSVLPQHSKPEKSIPAPSLTNCQLESVESSVNSTSLLNHNSQPSSGKPNHSSSSYSQPLWPSASATAILTNSTPPPIPHEEVASILHRAWENYKLTKRARLELQDG